MKHDPARGTFSEGELEVRIILPKKLSFSTLLHSKKSRSATFYLLYPPNKNGLDLFKKVLHSRVIPSVKLKKSGAFHYWKNW